MSSLIYFIFFWPLGSSLFGLIFRFALMGLVLNDCRLKGKPHLRWLLVVFFFGLWGFLAYMFLGSDVSKACANRMAKRRVIENITRPSEILRTLPSEHKGISAPPFEDPDPAADGYVDHYIEELLAAGEFDPSKFNRNAVRQELGIPDDVYVIGSIGRFSYF